MVCRGFLLRLERAGHIKQPPIKWRPNNPLVNRKKPLAVEVDTNPIEKTVKQLQPIEIEQVRGSKEEKVFNGLIEQYHYLGYSHPVGEQLKYIVYSHGREIACFAWSSAARHIGCRDRYIGWSGEVRKINIRYIGYNSRFLILPWVRSKYLASHLLGRIVREVRRDWERIYNHSIYYLESFVDREKFVGTSYQAANWIYVGKTTGRGKNDHTHKANRSIKAVWGYPLESDFRRLLKNV